MEVRGMELEALGMEPEVQKIARNTQCDEDIYSDAISSVILAFCLNIVYPS